MQEPQRLEKKMCLSNKFTVGVLLAKKGQKEDNMFLNPDTPNFLEFLNVLGHSENNDCNYSYSGFYKKSNDVWYTSWRGCEM